MKLKSFCQVIILIVLIAFPLITKATLPIENIDLGIPNCGINTGNCNNNNCVWKYYNSDCPIYTYFISFASFFPTVDITLDKNKYKACKVFAKTENSAGNVSANKITTINPEQMAKGNYSLQLHMGNVANKLYKAAMTNPNVNPKCTEYPLDENAYMSIKMEKSAWGTICKEKKLALQCLKNIPGADLVKFLDSTPIPPSLISGYDFRKIAEWAKIYQGQYYGKDGCSKLVSDILIASGFGNMNGRIDLAANLHDQLLNSGWTSYANPNLNDVKPGSVVFWFDNDPSNPIYHTGVYLGGGQVMHNSTGGGYTAQIGNIDSIGSNYHILAPKK